jgi:hypothetical protein
MVTVVSGNRIRPAEGAASVTCYSIRLSEDPVAGKAICRPQDRDTMTPKCGATYDAIHGSIRVRGCCNVASAVLDRPWRWSQPANPSV